MSTLRISHLLDQKVHAVDGEVGTIYDACFTDDTWRVEHLVLETGEYFHKRRLIMDPRLLLTKEATEDGKSSGEIRVAVTCADILASPDYMADPPISEQKAHDPLLHPRFLWFPKGDLVKLVARPMGAPSKDLEANEEKAREQGYNVHLQSFREVRGYSVYAAAEVKTSDDHEKACIGHVDDFKMSCHDQQIVQVVINTGVGKKEGALALQPRDVDHIDWADVHIYLHRSRAELGLPVW